jgi:MYXO-CTERM domain-containing protein
VRHGDRHGAAGSGLLALLAVTTLAMRRRRRHGERR